MIKDYNNITADDIRNITHNEIQSMTAEQSEKYGLALHKYAMLNRTASEPLTLKKLIDSLIHIEGVDDKTTVEVKLKNEYNENDKENFMSSEYCFVAYFDKNKNKIVIQNYV